MKRKILLSVLGAILFIGASNQRADAQTFIASFGVQQSWGVPIDVVHYIDDHYYGYKWVHTRQVVRHGMVDFVVIMQRGPVFFEITFDRFGRIYRTVRLNNYPLHNHVCDAYCGYHTNYYKTNYVVVHTNRKRAYYRPQWNGYGHYEHNKHYSDHKYKDGDRRDDRGRYDGDSGRSGDNGVRDHGKGYGKGKGGGNGHDSGGGRSGDYGKGNSNGRDNSGGKRSGYSRGSSGTSASSGERSGSSTPTRRVRGSGN
ncbi:MAG: hypothetical protein KDC79_13275 [Cyclobacteriaceae bacterium]|nr:hypothetical protein [Cyclobacteriaceae bacterium]